MNPAAASKERMSQRALLPVLICLGVIVASQLVWASSPLPHPTEAIPALAPLVLLALATFASEDAACVGAGALVAEGHLGLVAAVFACGAGIFVGDVGLFFAGRLLGRRILYCRPFRRVISPSSLAASASWLDARGASVILLSRFVPGTRLPTYVAAGVFGISTWRFLRAFALATMLWTPLLVGGSAQAAAWGGETLHAPHAGAMVAMLFCVLYVRRLATYAGRRRLLATWRRVIRWEFWPPWILYPPVLAWIALLMMRHRSATVFTAANPGMPAGGVVGESKSEILRGLQQGGAPVASFSMLTATLSPEARTARALAFAADHGWPVIIKPDQGQRGTGVRIVRSPDALAAATRELKTDTIIQAYVPGVEFGLFYARRLHEPCGRIVSTTEKQLPEVTGDGRRTLEELILADERAVAMWQVHTRANHDRLHDIVPDGVGVRLGDIGSHSRGAVFVDAHRLVTPALETAVDGAARAMPGFFFGRFDVRSASAEDLRAGRFTVLELNGVTSEPTHIYDSDHGVMAAYRSLAASWTLAFSIGAEQTAAGARTSTVRELVALACGYHRFARRSAAVTSGG
jgi:membrane protein DedA with SNARE-associated domain